MASPTTISIRKLATVVGRSAKTVHKHVHGGDWTFGPSPWPAKLLPKLKGYFAALPVDNAAVDGEDGARELERLSLKGKAQIQLIVNRAAKVKVETALLEGRYHSTEQCDREKIARVMAVKTALLSLPRGIAATLVGLNAQEIEAILYGRVVEVCQEFAGR